MRKRILTIFSVLISLVLISELANALEFDFSRRRRNLNKKEISRVPASADRAGIVGEFLGSTSPNREVVILNTEKGFVPKTLRLQKGKKYSVYVVNVNEKAKNVSFVLDAHAQYHSTYFGKIQHFEIQPRHDGVYNFQCPETSSEGRLVIYTGPQNSIQNRGLASEE